MNPSSSRTSTVVLTGRTWVRLQAGASTLTVAGREKGEEELDSGIVAKLSILSFQCCSRMMFALKLAQCSNSAWREALPTSAAMLTIATASPYNADAIVGLHPLPEMLTSIASAPSSCFQHGFPSATAEYLSMYRSRYAAARSGRMAAMCVSLPLTRYAFQVACPSKKSINKFSMGV